MSESTESGMPPAYAVAGGPHRVPVESAELYRDSTPAREPGHRAAPPAADPDTPVTALGLDPVTLARLGRCGLARLQQLLDCPVETLWRHIGRHGVADVVAQLARRGIPFGPLPDYARWRLGVLPREQAHVRIAPDTPVADLWPCLGRPVTEALTRRGLRTLSDLAPTSDEELRQLYRLGRSHLRRVLALLQAAQADDADDATLARLREGAGRIRACEGRSRHGRLRGKAGS